MSSQMKACLYGLIFVLINFVLGGCAAPMATRMSRVSVGMTKAQVMAAIGEPSSVAAERGCEYLNYRLATSFGDFDGSDTSDYYVRIVNGRVDSYGHRGDFRTTELPQTRTQIEIINKSE